MSVFLILELFKCGKTDGAILWEAYSPNCYRGNYIPRLGLVGAIMQLEKYLFHLNRYGANGEENLTNKYKSKLPKGLKIKITNPKGFIIMGRENSLNQNQKNDFEIVKRKYKNVIDMLSSTHKCNALFFRTSIGFW